MRRKVNQRCRRRTSVSYHRRRCECGLKNCRLSTGVGVCLSPGWCSAPIRGHNRLRGRGQCGQWNERVRCLCCGHGFHEGWDTIRCPACGSEDY